MLLRSFSLSGLTCLVVLLGVLASEVESGRIGAVDAQLDSINFVEWSCDSSEATLGDTVICTARFESPQYMAMCGSDNPRLRRIIWPFMDGYQWGAQTQLTPTGQSCMASIGFPMPNVGSFELQMAVLPAALELPAVGRALPSGATATSKFLVKVRAAPAGRFIPKPANGDQRVMYWEPWFTKSNGAGRWTMAEAIPMTGTYSSIDIVDNTTTAKANRNVLKMHCIWWAMAGVTAIGVDWTNNVFNIPSYAARGADIQQLMAATLYSVEVLSEFEAEGIPVPQIVLILGLNNGAKAKPSVLNDEIEYINRVYLGNPKMNRFMMRFDGKPLLLIFDGNDSHAYMPSNILPAAAGYTVRWMGSQFQSSHLNDRGLFSWMDATIRPLPTPQPGNPSGRPEALTITNAFFGNGGWFGPQSRTPKNGGTLLLEADYAVSLQPKLTFICQWNEFLGEQDNAGNSYADIYNASFGNDMEPTSLTACGPVDRPHDPNYMCGGWGFSNLNLLRAFSLRMQNPQRESLVIAIESPVLYIPHSISDAMTTSVAVAGKCSGITHVELRVMTPGRTSSVVKIIPTGDPVAGQQLVVEHLFDPAVLRSIGVGYHTMAATAFRGSEACTSDAPMEAPQRFNTGAGAATSAVNFRLLE